MTYTIVQRTKGVHPSFGIEDGLLEVTCGHRHYKLSAAENCLERHHSSICGLTEGEIEVNPLAKKRSMPMRAAKEPKA